MAVAPVAATPGASPSPTATTVPGTTVKVDTGQAVTSLSRLLLHAYHVALIVVVALVVRALVLRSIARFARSVASGRLHRGLSRLEVLSEPEAATRREQRAATIGSVLRSVANAVIVSLAAILVLGELGLDLAPILASAGIVGVAVGFGAQSVVKDFLAGLFLVLEDQYGVGDVIDLQKDVGVTGTVEAIGLRTTRVRDVRGNLWHVRNGNVNQVGNVTQGWSRVLLDVVFALGVPVATAREVLAEAAARAAGDPDDPSYLDEPAVWGVEDLTAAGVTVRLAVRTASARRDEVTRALREQVLAVAAERDVALAGEPVAAAPAPPPAARPRRRSGSAT